jgi:hypothetical protein
MAFVRGAKTAISTLIIVGLLFLCGSIVVQLVDLIAEDTGGNRKSTDICIHPVFTEVKKLEAELRDHPEKLQFDVDDAITYLRLKYCRSWDGPLTADTSTPLGDNCFQYSGMFRGELVYWGECKE